MPLTGRLYRCTRCGPSGSDREERVVQIRHRTKRMACSLAAKLYGGKVAEWLAELVPETKR
jgi:hypothetical protein